MKLTGGELRELYEAVVKPFGHPDPLGFMTRALIQSEGDPDYIDVLGKQGFMPVSPGRALSLTGAQEIQSLQSNVIATLTMDRLAFNEHATVRDMIISFHFGESVISEAPTKEQEQLIEDINDSREDTMLIMYPPLATVEDVINLIDDSNADPRLSNSKIKFFEELLKG